MSWTRIDDCERPRIINPYRYSANTTPEPQELHEFYFAAVSGDLDRLKRAITPDLDLETLFGDGWGAHTALHGSARHLNVFGFLLALGVNPFALSWAGHEQPLHSAADYKQPETVQFLLDLGADVNSTFAKEATLSPRAATALWVAVHAKRWKRNYSSSESEDRVGTIDILVSHGAEFPPSTEVYNSWSEANLEPGEFSPPIPQDEDTLFLKALSSGSKVLWNSYLEKRRGLSLPERTEPAANQVPHDLMRVLEDFGRHDETYSALSATGWSFDDKLSQDWKQERVEMARILLDSREQHDPRSKNLISILCFFSIMGNLLLMELMLERGADPNAAGENGAVALLAACGSTGIPFPTIKVVTELLVQYGATFDGRIQDSPSDRYRPPLRTYIPGNTCLHEWTKRRDSDTLQYLLDAGADVNATNNLGETVIMRFAIKMRDMTKDAYLPPQNNYASFKTLIEAGANIDTRDNLGRTLLHHFASSFDRLSMNACVKEGGEKESPFVASTREDAVLCLKLLVSLGAVPGAEDAEGKRPIDRFDNFPSKSKMCLGGDLASFFGFGDDDQDGGSSKET